MKRYVRAKEEGKRRVIDRLKRDIRKITREKESFVYQTGQKENRLFRILEAFQMLEDDNEFKALLKAHKLDEMPTLKGNYSL